MKGVNEKYKQYMGIFLVLVQDKSLNKKIAKEVTYNFCLLNESGQKVNLVRSQESREFKENDQWGFPKFLSKSLIDNDYNNLLHNDCLTILVEMCVFGNISTLDKSENEGKFDYQLDDKTLNLYFYILHFRQYKIGKFKKYR